MTDPEMMSIGVFAELVGSTASALRFYDDAGLLRPAQVDPSTGYRFYSRSQVPRACRLRQLREIGMPLLAIGEFFATGADEAARLLDDHVAGMTTEAERLRRAAETLGASLRAESRRVICTVPGPFLAGAVDQVSASTGHDPDIPVLNGVHMETGSGCVRLTATDRYRLATRTLVPTDPTCPSWAGTLAGDDLRVATSQLRRSPSVTVEADERAVTFRTSGDDVLHCRLLPEPFPDHRLLLDSLPAATQRVTLGKRRVVTVLEQRAPETVGLRTSPGRPALVFPDGDEIPLDGTATGAESTIWFDLVTVYPAWSHALGDDLMLDIRGTDLPVTVRSADDGDLTTLVMPRSAP
ncbi:DNA polymerase III subunit beta family protein [Rhodococcus sp. R1101]|uniref:DNA polymerase III subunit beta family protein n=1 Tax=Rhodococcus sp. R1101 TaxID=1170698 RepID=UPI0002F966A2|nr:MerR family transcriptional regulator [Rhodococcus sp. R1101]